MLHTDRKNALASLPELFRTAALIRAFLLLVSIVLAPSAAWAVSCTVSVTAMNFGSYTGSAATPGPTPVTVNCTSGSSYYVAVNAGLNNMSMNYNWQIVGPSTTYVGYKLYRDTARSQLFGGTSGVDTVAGTGSGGSQTVNIYPTVASNPAVVPGSYSDTVTVSVHVSGGTTVTASMNVSATVSAFCSVSVLPLSFGTYSGQQIDTSSTMTVTCTNTTSYSANVDQGLHYSSFYHPRMIGPGGAYLSYELYRDSARAQLWGNTAYSDGITGTGSGYAQSLTIYTRSSAGQYVRPGSYVDTITVTINY